MAEVAVEAVEAVVEAVEAVVGAVVEVVVALEAVTRARAADQTTMALVAVATAPQSQPCPLCTLHLFCHHGICLAPRPHFQAGLPPESRPRLVQGSCRGAPRHGSPPLQRQRLHPLPCLRLVALAARRAPLAVHRAMVVLPHQPVGRCAHPRATSRKPPLSPSNALEPMGVSRRARFDVGSTRSAWLAAARCVANTEHVPTTWM